MMYDVLWTLCFCVINICLIAHADSSRMGSFQPCFCVCAYVCFPHDISKTDHQTRQRRGPSWVLETHYSRGQKVKGQGHRKSTKHCRIFNPFI